MFNITLVGHLTRDVEIKQRSDGSSYMQGSVAVNIAKDNVLYVTFFSNNTKLAQYLKKGKHIGVSGSGIISTWKNKAGDTKINVSISDASISFINSGKSNNNPGGGSKKPYQDQSQDLDSIPF